MIQHRARAWRPWHLGAVVVLFLSWAVVAHLGSTGRGSADVHTAVALLPLLAAWTVLLERARSRGLRLAGFTAAAILVLVSWPSLRQNVPLLYYLQHLGSHLALAAFFGRTLRGPGEPLITSMARMIHGDDMSQRKASYTRGVTFAWAVFFAANALVSTGLYLWAPEAVWSVHANLLTGPLVGLMFLSEHLLRRRILPVHERPSLSDVVRAYRQRTSRTAVPTHHPEAGT